MRESKKEESFRLAAETDTPAACAPQRKLRLTQPPLQATSKSKESCSAGAERTRAAFAEATAGQGARALPSHSIQRRPRDSQGWSGFFLPCGCALRRQGDYLRLAFADGAGRPFSAADAARPFAVGDARTHLLLVMLSGHLLLMMLSIHLLLMIHRLLPMSRAFVLDSFVVGPGLVSLNVVIVAVKVFSFVFVPVILGPKLLAMFFTAHSCSLAVMFTDVSGLVPAFPRPLPHPEGYVHLRSPVCFQLLLLLLPLRPRVPARLCLAQRLRSC